MSPEPADDEDDNRAATLLGQLRLARGRPDRALHAEILLAKLIASFEPDIREQIEWRAYTQQPSVADIDEMVQGVRLGIIKDIENVLAGRVELGAVIGRKISDQVAEFARRRARRAGEISDGALAAVGVLDADRVFLSERFFGGLRPDEIARRHGAHRRVVDTATSRALRKLLGSEALDDQRAVRELDPPAVEES